MASSMAGLVEMVIILVMFGLALLSSAQQPDQLYNLCSNRSYTGDSPYAKNLGDLLHKIRSIDTITQIHNGSLYNISAGQDPNRVYAIAMCRLDATAPDCHRCLSQSVDTLPGSCPSVKDAVGWYGNCTLYYSQDSMVGMVDDSTAYRQLCSSNRTTSSVLNTSRAGNIHDQALRDLVSSLQRKAGNSTTLKYATGKANVSAGSNDTFTGLMQCTPHVNQTNCNTCLQSLVDFISRSSSRPNNSSSGARLFSFSCNTKFQANEFLSAGLVRPPIIDPTGRRRSYWLEIIAIPTILGAMLIIATCVIVRMRKSSPTPEAEEEVSEIQAAEALQFNFRRIKAATRNFSQDRKLGQGGFGAVYQGRLDDGQEVAVKRLSKKSGQGKAEFKTEVVLLAGLQHRNLVKLLGFCVSGKEKILVYEYLPNSSLDKILFDAAKKANLDWTTRFKIICGIAKGLLYLHEDSRLKIVHRDLKSSNILLDNAMNPKIADFGLARLLGVDQTQDETNKIAGTYGYMAPEYAMTGQFSVRSDVYSFGIIVLEVVSGQKNKILNRSPNEEALLFRAWRLWMEEKILELVDPYLGPNYCKEELMKCIDIGLLCTQEDPSKRPSMTSIVASLSGHSVTLPSPTPPNFFNWSAANGSQEVQTTTNSTEPESITEISAR